MKELIALLLCAAFIFTAACAAPQKPDADPTVPSETEVPPSVTDPPVTDPPVTAPPVEDPPPAHEKFDMVATKHLRGIWATPIVLDGQLLNLTGFEEEVTFQLYYSFDKHGYFSIFLDEKAFTDALDTYESLVIEYMVDKNFHSFRGKYEYSGLTEEEILAMWAEGPEQESRQDCTEFVATLNLYHICMKLVRQGQYYIDGDQLYTQLSDTAFECNTFLWSNGSLTLKSTDNVAAYRSLRIAFPLVFTR